MNRNPIFNLLLIVIFTLSCGPKQVKLTQSSLAKRPNLLIIMTDEHNFRTLGCYRETLEPEQAYMWGKTVVETHNIDWLAHQGVLCTSFYASTPVCSPSRGSFVSGRYPQNTPVAGNDIPLHDDIITFAEVLQQQGYSTGYAGKWHLDGTAKPGWAPTRNFGFVNNRYMFNRGHWKQLGEGTNGPEVITKNQKGEYNYAIEGANEENFTTDFLVDRTIEFIEKNKSVPFCHMLSLPDPHGPNTVRPPYDQMFDENMFVQAKTFTEPFDRTYDQRPQFKMKGHNMATYHGMVKCIDDNIGKLIHTLRKNELLENTIIVFTSDHGDMCGEHELLNKGNPYEASAKVPFILYYPQKIAAGKIVNQSLSSVDFMPTILDLMQAPIPNEVEGRNSVSLLTTNYLPDNWKDIVFIRGTLNRGWLAAISDRYKLVYFRETTPVLYDLELDPDESVNYYEDPNYQDIVLSMTKEINLYAQKYKDPYVQHKNLAKYLVPN